jgi:hypothetical protein
VSVVQSWPSLPPIVVATTGTSRPPDDFPPDFRLRTLVVCEGIPDALTAAGGGFQAVAVLGSQAPDQSVGNRLAGFARLQGAELVAIVDNDPAGLAWGERLDMLLAGMETALRIVEPPQLGMDLNTWSVAGPVWASSIVDAAHLPEASPVSTAD